MATSDSMRILLPLVAAIVAVSLYTNSQNPNFLTQGNVEVIAVQTSTLAIIAVGQTFLMASGQLDLSVGSLASLAGVLSARWLLDGWNEAAVVAMCVLIAAGISAVWGLIVISLRVPPFILTLGGLSVLSSIALQRAGSQPVPLPTGLEWLRTGSVAGLRWPIALSLVTLLAASVTLRYTRFGRCIYSVGSSEEAAYLAGLPVRRTKLLAFVISGALVGLAGIMLCARVGAGDPRAGEGFELRAISAVVLGGASLAGGRGSPLGSYAGVLLLGVIGTALNFLDIDAAFEGLVFGGVLVVAVTLTALTGRGDRSPVAGLRALTARPFARPPDPDPSPDVSADAAPADPVPADPVPADRPSGDRS